MISVLMMMIQMVTNAVVYLLKAVFSLLLWFLKALKKALKLFFVVLPITSIVFGILMLLCIFVLCTGSSGTVLTAPFGGTGNESMGTVLSDTFGVDGNMKSAEAIPAVTMFSDLKTWWMDNIYSLKGSSSYILLLFLTILMFIPVMTVFLVISVFTSYGAALFIAVVTDAALYIVRATMGKSFVAQALSRYYRLFPDAGRRHEERRYNRLMKERNDDLEAENRSHRKRREEEFYEDDSYSDGYDEDYEYEDEYYPEDHDEEYYDDEYDPEFDEEYGSDDEDYEDDYEDEFYEPGYEVGHRAVGSFDFFAGCNSRESVDKKYRSLVKLYHPDNMDGDTAALQEINFQYSVAKKKWT